MFHDIYRPSSIASPKAHAFTEEHELFQLPLQSTIRIGVVYLSNNFTPSERDVICGRAKHNFYHVGNERFRQLVSANVRRYLTAKTRVDKGVVVRSIMDQVRNEATSQNQGGEGGFVRQDPLTGTWFMVDDATAREKVGATLRSMIRKAGGEEALLSQLSTLDNDQNNNNNHSHSGDSPASGGESLTGWLPPSVAAETLIVSTQSQNDNVDTTGSSQTAAASNTVATELRGWRTTGLEDITEPELNWLTRTDDIASKEVETQPINTTPTSDSAQMPTDDQKIGIASYRDSTEEDEDDDG